MIDKFCVVIQAECEFVGACPLCQHKDVCRRGKNNYPRCYLCGATGHHKCVKKEKEEN